MRTLTIMLARSGLLLLAIATLSTLGSWTPRALAETANCYPADGLSTCIASDQLWTHGGSGPWFSQAPTQLPRRGELLTSFTASFVHRPVGLRVSSPDPEGTTIYAVDNALGGQLSFAYGLHPRSALSLIAPFVLYQDGASKADVVGSDQQLPGHAMGDVRLGTHVGILPDDASRPHWPTLALRFEMSLPTGDVEAFSSSPSVGFAPGVSTRQRFGSLSVGADLGARLRREVELAGSLIGSDITGSIGASFAVLEASKLNVGAEIFTRISLLEQTTRVVHPITSEISYRTADQHHIPTEWLLSARSEGWYRGQLSFAVAGGSFIPTGPDVPVTAPAARVMASVAFSSRNATP